MCREALPTERVGRGASCRTWTKPLVHLHGATLHASRGTRGRDLPPVYGARSLHACSRVGAHAGPRGQYEGACEVANIAHAPFETLRATKPNCGEATRSGHQTEVDGESASPEPNACVERARVMRHVSSWVSRSACHRAERRAVARAPSMAHNARSCVPPSGSGQKIVAAHARANNVRPTVVLGKTCLAQASVSEELPLHQ